jgi:hypothetical protein
MLSGNIAKMDVKLGKPVEYHLPIGENSLAINPYLDRQLTIRYNGAIHCVACGVKTKKSFSQGFCYRCCTRLAQCDMCIMKPETCHYHLGTCREPEYRKSKATLYETHDDA